MPSKCINTSLDTVVCNSMKLNPEYRGELFEGHHLPMLHESVNLKSNTMTPIAGASNGHIDNMRCTFSDPADYHINKNVLIEPIPVTCSAYIQPATTHSRSPSPIISDGDSGYSSKQMSPVSLV